MKWPDGPLVMGIFIERLHRFGATVEVNGKIEYCHVTNSGRLRELLCPGATVALVDHQNQPLSNSKAPRKTGEKAWIEVKCVTLVDEKGVGHFPDAPSERASKHLRELMALSRKPKTKCFVFFILQNPLGKGVTPKDDTDPLFGKTLRQTTKTPVQLHAYSAQVSLKEAQLDKAIPVLLK